MPRDLLAAEVVTGGASDRKPMRRKQHPARMQLLSLRRHVNRNCLITFSVSDAVGQRRNATTIEVPDHTGCMCVEVHRSRYRNLLLLPCDLQQVCSLRIRELHRSVDGNILIPRIGSYATHHQPLRTERSSYVQHRGPPLDG